VEKRGLSVAALIALVSFIGVAANSAGVLNSPSGGYLVCVDSKTKVITHPGSTSCPKGSKKLVLGAQGAAGTIGLTGAAGLSGKDGVDGKDGKTLWNGIKDPENTWGAPGDMFINSVTKTLFGPKDLDETWPVGVSMVGPKGDQGPMGLTGAAGPSGGSGPAGPAGANGTNATIAITELFVCDGPDAGTVANEKCKIGMTGPGGGLIFFVDYNDIYAGFNYLEAAPEETAEIINWSNVWNNSVLGVTAAASRAVGRGQTNTNAIVAASISGAAIYADSYISPIYNGAVKSDWFLGSLGEMQLMNDILRFTDGYYLQEYWSSSEAFPDHAWFLQGTNGTYYFQEKGGAAFVRPIRAF
jgi:hypothetical protein